MISERVSVIATIYNEYGNLPAWCAGLEQQSRSPDELVIVDGGSSDGSWEYLTGRSWRVPCRVISMPGATISEGRNRAIEESTGGIVAVTDAGTIADREWLAELVAPFEDPNADVSAGFFRTADGSIWERSLGAATLPLQDEIDPSKFQPSSRSVAFRRPWLDRGLRYPEWLDFCEDLVLDLSLRRAGARFSFTPAAQVTFAPRPSWKAFFRQYFRYARGDGKAGLFAGRHAIRYVTYAGGTAVAIRRRPMEIMIAAVLGALYLRRPARRLLKIDSAAGVSRRSTMAGLALLPIHRLVGDIAKMLGYPVGLLWRVRRFGVKAPKMNWKRIPPVSRRPQPTRTREILLSRASRDA